MRAAALTRTAFSVLAAGAALQAGAAGVFIEDIQVSKRGDEATVTVELACPMRFQSDARTAQGILLEIRVAPLESCRQLGGDAISSEVYRPAGGQLAFLSEVEYESLGLGENLLLFHFDRAVDYRVTQRGDLRSLQLLVRPATGAADSARQLEVPQPRNRRARPRRRRASPPVDRPWRRGCARRARFRTTS